MLKCLYLNFVTDCMFTIFFFYIYIRVINMMCGCVVVNEPQVTTGSAVVMREGRRQREWGRSMLCGDVYGDRCLL
jgi:hypothetical protein